VFISSPNSSLAGEIAISRFLPAVQPAVRLSLQNQAILTLPIMLRNARERVCVASAGAIGGRQVPAPFLLPGKETDAGFLAPGAVPQFFDFFG
jgi:hypothetical protein